MCHASSQEKNAYQNQVSTTAALNSHLDTIFKDNSNILGNLKTGLQPIIDAGESQFGFAKPEEAALRTNAADNIEQGNRATSDKVRSIMAAQGGGTSFLPNGGQAAVDQSLALNEAGAQADAQNQVTQAGFEKGRENFFNASAMLPSATASLEAPITNAGENAQSGAGAQSRAANSITQANNAWIAPVGGILGGVASKAVTALPV